MERVTPERIGKVARLARLELSPEDTELFASQLETVLDHAESLATLDTGGVQPFVGAASPHALRADEPRPSLDRELALAAAPDAADGLFRVPRILP